MLKAIWAKTIALGVFHKVKDLIAEDTTYLEQSNSRNHSGSDLKGSTLSISSPSFRESHVSCQQRAAFNILLNIKSWVPTMTSTRGFLKI